MTRTPTAPGDRPPFGEGPSALIFDHVYKCAGTTFRGQLQARFRSFYDVSTLESWQRHQPALAGETAATVAIAGHAALGIHELLPRTYVPYYITVLREPFARACSAFRFEREWYSPCTSLPDYLRMCRPNHLVHHLGNGSFDLALERLHTFYHVFGLVERFDDFLSSLTRVLGIDFTTYSSRNRTQRAGVSRDEPLRAEFNERNDLDLRLYAEAETLFERRFQASETRALPPEANMIPDQPEVPEYIPSDPVILDLIARRDFHEAAHQLDHAPLRNDEAERYAIFQASAALHAAAGEYEQALQAHRHATAISRERAIAEASLLAPSAPDRALQVLTDALSHYSAIVSQQPDSIINRFRQEAFALLAKISREGNDEPSATRYTREAIRINPESATAKRLEARLAHADYIRTQWHALHGTRAVLFGSGEHTRWLERITREVPGPTIIAVIDDHPPAGTCFGMKVIRPDGIAASAFDSIVISTDTANLALRARAAAAFGPGVRIVDWYATLPPGPYPKDL